LDKGVVVLRHDKGGPVAVEYEGAHGGRLLRKEGRGDGGSGVNEVSKDRRSRWLPCHGFSHDVNALSHLILLRSRLYLLVLASSMLVVQVLIVIVGSVFLPSSYNCTFLILFLFVLVLLFFLGIQGNLKDDP